MPPTCCVGLEVRIMLRAIPTRILILTMLAALAAPLFGCHADENDPEGQAEELADPVRRQNAIHNLHRIYTTALADASGNRAAPEVVAVADVIVPALNDTYLNFLEDRSNGQAILDWGGFSMQGYGVGWLKRTLDRRLVSRFAATVR